MEEKLKRLNALLGALRHVNRLIVKEKNRDRLLQGICDTLVNNLGYYNVWISLFDKHGNFISGFESGVGPNFSSLVDQLGNGKLCDCAVKAMAQPAVVVIENPQSCGCCPLAKMYGGRSGLSARLEYAGSIYGVITASTPISSMLYEDERSLFKELADDIAFALYRLELEKERDKALELLRQSEEKFSKVFHNSPIAMTISRLPDGVWVDVNESFLQLTEYAREEVIGHSSVELNIFEDNFEKHAEIINLLRTKGSVSNIEVGARTKSGKRLKFLLSAAKVNVGGQDYAITMNMDITERVSAEGALRRIHDELEERFRERTKELKETAEKLQREIADRVKAEKLIENERKRFFDVLEKLPVYLVLLTPDHHVAYANRFFRERFGEDHGRHCFEYLFGRTQPCEICETYKVLQTMAPLEWEWTGPDGRIYYIYDAPFTDVDGSTLILEVGIDITERRKAEEALRKAHDELEMRVSERTKELAEAYEKLRESERDLNRAQAVAHIGSWRLDLRNNVLQWSDEAYRIFGIPKGTPLTYEAFLAAVHPQDREYVDQKWKAALQGKPYDIEHRIIVNGEVKWVREKAELELDKVNGTVISGFGTVQDITERKQAEQALYRAKQEWERTFDAIPDMIAILDDKHRIVQVNQAMAKQLGAAPEQCIGLPCYKAVHGKEQPIECCPHAKTLKNGQEHIEEIYDERFGGYFLISTTPLKDEKGQMIGSVHVARNITDLK
ncbi:MAG: PAS domain S-box protein, partial [Candidatus Bathyarchaeia archaeon]